MSQKNILGIGILIIIILAAAFFFAHKASAPTATTTGAATPGTSAPYSHADSATYDAAAGIPPTTISSATVVTYNNTGFSPKSVSIKAGETVRFVNNSTHQMWVASNNHPTHTLYDGTSLSQHCSNGVGTSFDECVAINPGSVFNFTFPKAGSFTYHNHMQASDTGSITVTAS